MEGSQQLSSHMALICDLDDGLCLWVHVWAVDLPAGIFFGFQVSLVQMHWLQN